MRLHFYKDIFLILCLSIIFTESTVDITYSQFQYLSTHLTEFECRRLVAALHFHSYKLNSRALDAAANALSDGLNCLDLLLEWNSAENEGKGQTHEIVNLRLRQLGYPELANWLSHNVYDKLEKELTALTPVNVLLTTNETNASVLESDEESWSLIITIEHIILMTIFIIAVQKACKYICVTCFTLRKSKSRVDFNKLKIKGFKNERRLSDEYRSLLSEDIEEFSSEEIAEKNKNEKSHIV